MMKKKQTLDQWFRYIIIGALTAIVDFGMLYVLGVYLSWNAALAAAVAFLTALLFHFSMNKYFNFRNFERTSYAQLRTYLIVTTVSFGSTIFFIHVFTKYAGITILWAKVFTSLINMSWGFPAQKFLTFGKGIRETGYRLWLEVIQKYR